MNFKFENRDNMPMLDDFGKFLVRVLQITPKGVLIFFTSYRVMQQAHERWKSIGVIAQMEALKKICVEVKANNLVFIRSKPKDRVS